MNRGFLIVLIPAILAAIGYILVFHIIGVAPACGRMVSAGSGGWAGGRKRRRRPGRSRRASAIDWPEDGKLFE